VALGLPAVAHGDDDVILADGVSVGPEPQNLAPANAVAYEDSTTGISADAGEHINGANLRSIEWTLKATSGIP
jgi:hypothetical protein